MNTYPTFTQSEDVSDESFEYIDKILNEFQRVIRGKREFLELLISAFLAGGHVLLEDLPGLGKTTVARTLARLISSVPEEQAIGFKRIQFTPDLLPYDITGVDIFDPEQKNFVFSPGPVFTNILLADEINRTTPKVQSALLEVMAENQVTVGNRTHHIGPLFFVIATQNPIEIEGTYPLPLAQIDRFLMKLKLGYPDRDYEFQIVKDDPLHKIMPELVPVCTKEDILQIQEKVESVYCDDKLIHTVVAIASETREYQGVQYGISPRGSLMLIKAARAYALIKKRTYVIDQDIIDLAPKVLAHRLKMKDMRLVPEEIISEVTRAQIEKYGY